MSDVGGTRTKTSVFLKDSPRIVLPLPGGVHVQKPPACSHRPAAGGEHPAQGTRAGLTVPHEKGGTGTHEGHSPAPRSRDQG